MPPMGKCLVDFTTRRIVEVFKEGAVMRLYRLIFEGEDGTDLQ